MPGFDGTGPKGRGKMTGGGMGKCNPLWKKRRGDKECMTPEERLEALKEYKKEIEAEIVILEKEIK